jgi:hypothetical protein
MRTWQLAFAAAWSTGSAPTWPTFSYPASHARFTAHRTQAALRVVRLLTNAGTLPGAVALMVPCLMHGRAARLFQGHTRFATSSICNLAGCHPHQWLPRSMQKAWRLTSDGTFVSEQRNVESFITHNGDLDFFVVHGTTLPLSDLQMLLARLLGRPMPSDVDSACVAGLLDLLRTKGLWLASVRKGCASMRSRPPARARHRLQCALTHARRARVAPHRSQTCTAPWPA